MSDRSASEPMSDYSRGFVEGLRVGRGEERVPEPPHELDVQASAAPRHRWQIGRYQIEYERGRWGMSDGSKGVGGCRTLLGAWLALRRWRRTPSRGGSSR